MKKKTKAHYLADHLVAKNFLLVENLDCHTLPRLNLARELHLSKGPLPERPPQLVLPDPRPARAAPAPAPTAPHPSAAPFSPLTFRNPSISTPRIHSSLSTLQVTVALLLAGLPHLGLLQTHLPPST